MISIESTGKTVKQAIEDGLKKIDKSLDEVEVKIITQPGIFKKAKVLISVEGAEILAPKKSEPVKQEKNAIVSPLPHKKIEEQPKRQETPKKEFHKKHDMFASKKDKEDKSFIKEEKQPISKPVKSSEKPKEIHKEKEYQAISDDAAKTASSFVEKLVKSIDPEAAIISRIDGGALGIKINSNNGAVIGYKGETLDAIEYLTLQAINKGDLFYKIGVDCNEYRIKRQEMLVSKAKHLAEKAIKSGRKIVMEPMSNHSRKIIHSALQDNDKVFTKSEGNDPHRHIVIIPKRKGGSYGNR
ncbi:MAG: Jag N-terminal domain-containing protein [Firmicutes bacterium]|nr:Jag N-terminal domain-containing protein [Bacillota bacterium]